MVLEDVLAVDCWTVDGCAALMIGGLCCLHRHYWLLAKAFVRHVGWGLTHADFWEAAAEKVIVTLSTTHSLLVKWGLHPNGKVQRLLVRCLDATQPDMFRRGHRKVVDWVQHWIELSSRTLGHTSVWSCLAVGLIFQRALHPLKKTIRWGDFTIRHLC